MAFLGRLSKYSSFGLLIIRAGLGIMMILHGYPKLMGGPEKWAKLGKAMGDLGIDFAPEFWGFMAAFAEGVGGLLLLLGFLFRPATALLIITMVVAAFKHLNGGDSVLDSSHAIELAVVFLGLFFIGPGKYSIDKK